MCTCTPLLTPLVLQKLPVHHASGVSADEEEKDEDEVFAHDHDEEDVDEINGDKPYTAA